PVADRVPCATSSRRGGRGPAVLVVVVIPPSMPESPHTPRPVRPQWTDEPACATRSPARGDAGEFCGRLRLLRPRPPQGRLRPPAAAAGHGHLGAAHRDHGRGGGPAPRAARLGYGCGPGGQPPVGARRAG